MHYVIWLKFNIISIYTVTLSNHDRKLKYEYNNNINKNNIKLSCPKSMIHILLNTV